MFTVEDGLPAAEVLDVAQSADGFLWIATNRGLVRFDGEEMRRWGKTVHHAALDYVRIGPSNKIVTGRNDEVAYEVVSGGLRVITAPGGERASRFRSCHYDRNEDLWCTVEHSLLRRARDGNWHEIDPEDFDSETPYDISSLPENGMLLCTKAGGLWTVDVSGRTHEVLHAPFPIVQALALDQQDYVFAEHRDDTEIVVRRWTKGRVRELARSHGRIADIEARAGSIWMSFANGVILIPQHEGFARRASVVDGIESGAGMTVDHEGGLWIGTPKGLVYMPEPDTLTWTVHHDLSSVSRWSAEGNADDLEGDNDGTLQNGATFDPSLEGGRAFRFDGVDDHVEVGEKANLSFGPTEPMTVDAWVCRTGESTVMHVLGKRDGCGGVGATGINYQMAFDPGLGLHFGGDTLSGNVVATGISPPIDEWTHLAGTFDGSRFRFYVDGVLRAESVAGKTLGESNSAPFKIGGSGSCGFPWEGLIDEVKIYRRALTDADIEAIFVAGAKGSCDEKPSSLVRSLVDAGEGVWPASSIVGTDEGVWAASWHGLVRARWEEGQPRVRPFLLGSIMKVCADSAGGVWTGQFDAEGVFRLFRIRGDAISSYQPALVDRLHGMACSLSGNGRLWISLGRTILRVEPRETEPRRVTVLDESLPLPTGILEGRAGVLWVHGPNETLCAGSVGELIQTGATTWSCENLGPGFGIRQLAETPTGETWMAHTAGVSQRSDDRWMPLLTSEELGAPWVQRLQTSRWGGMWVAGPGFVKRFAKVGASWALVEAPTSWHGVPLSVARGVYEDDHDNLWVMSLKGLTYIPARVRRHRLPPPRVSLAGARVEGEEVRGGEPIRLRKASDLIELYFSALSFRGRARLQYRIRWNEGEWTQTTTPVIRAAGMGSGAYRIEAAATVDGKNWSEPPAVVTFYVPKPWYLRWWAIGLAFLMVGTAAYSLYRVRLSYHLGLEQQRARIAMDLHDELGSGLATINVIADLAAADHVPRDQQVAIAREISESATTLGRSLTDLVWSLRQDSSTLDALMSHLAERAGQLFADGKPELRVSFPESIPAEPLSLPVCRNVQMIVLEALNNIRKHADADEVELGLLPDKRSWRLWVNDNGVGSRSKAVVESSGLGLLSMRQRAEEIGAEFHWVQDVTGTSLSLKFSPREPRSTGRNVRAARPR